MEESNPSLAAAYVEIETLKERLRVSDDWNVRLQNQIQELLQLPKNEVVKFRERMKEPDIAIPLLQCYDSTIAEKTEQLEKYKQEVVELNAKLHTLTSEQSEWSSAIKVAEELANHVKSKSEEELSNARKRIESLQTEFNTVRLELARALESEHDMKAQEEKNSRKLQELSQELDTLRVEKAKLEEALSILQKRLQSKNAAEEEYTAQGEAKRIQLQLLKAESEDKVQEVERIRSKMIQALRLSTENHNVHLRMVEEKHRAVVEELQNINRTQELETMKLRAQLARIDPSNPSNLQLNTALRSQSTTELLDAQTRQSQEIELKRLYAELSAVQVQRDEAVLRYEQLTLNLRRDHEVELQELRREKQLLQRKVEEYRSRCDRLEQQKVDTEAQILPLRDRVQTLQSANDTLRSENSSLLHKKEELLRKITDIEIAQSQAKEQEQLNLAEERKRSDQLEERVSEVLRQLQEEKDKAYSDSQTAVRQRDTVQKQLYELSQKCTQVENLLAREQRESKSLQAQLERMNEALRLHRDQIKNYEIRIDSLQKDVEVFKQRERSHLLGIEQLKVKTVVCLDLNSG